MKRNAAVIIFTLILIITGTACSSDGDDANVKALYEDAKGYRASIEYTVIEPIAATVYKFDFLFVKPDSVKYTVITPETFAGMELTVESAGSVLKYAESEIFIPPELTQAPTTVLFDLPALIQKACDNYKLGLTEDGDDWVFKMMAQEMTFGRAKYFVHFNKETLLPSRCIVKGTGGEFEAVMVINDFEYLTAQTVRELTE